MHHHLKVSAQEFEAIKGKKRHIITKLGDYRQGDTLTITQDGTREQMSLAIIEVNDLHKRSTILTLFAPYFSTDDLPDTVG